MIDVARDILIPLHGEPLRGQESVAARFGKTRACVDKWRLTGRLECARIGNRWFTTADALNDFAKDNSSSAAKERQTKKKNRTNPRYLAAKEKLEQQFG